MMKAQNFNFAPNFPKMWVPAPNLHFLTKISEEEAIFRQPKNWRGWHLHLLFLPPVTTPLAKVKVMRVCPHYYWQQIK